MSLDADRNSDGCLWARGDRYKMRLAADGAQDLPLFSSRTPRHFPLHFTAAAKVEPVLHENGCSFERGDVIERCDLRPEGAEQTFVLQSRPAGDALTLPVATERHGARSRCLDGRFFADQSSGCLAGDLKFFAMGALGALTPIVTIARAVGDDDRNVDIAWNGTHGLIAWDRDMGSHRDVFGQPFSLISSSYAAIGGIRNLSAMEPGITLSADQQRPEVASDGTRFAVCYLEGATPNRWAPPSRW